MSERKWSTLERALAAASLAFILIAAAGLFFLVSFASVNVEAHSTVGGRQVIGRATGLLSGVGMADDAQGTTVSLSGGEVRVTAAMVIIGGRQIPIPAACTRIELEPASDGVRLLFDGQPPAP